MMELENSGDLSGESAPEAAAYSHGKIDEGTVAELLPFAGLSDKKLRELLSFATIRRVAANDTFYEEGDPSDHFFILLDGYVRFVRITQDGEQVVMLYVPPGEMFGISKALESTTYHLTAKAVSSGFALSWPSELWDRFAAEFPAFTPSNRKTVGRRMNALQEKIVEISTHQVEQRIALAILRLMRQAGRIHDGSVEIDFPLTRQDISELTGTTMHSVSRCMSAWQKSGIVQSSRKRVIVLKPEALRSIAHQKSA